MEGTQFERDFCGWLKMREYWALNIPRSKNGAQPFDVVAMRGRFVLMCDCKVVSSKAKRFPLVRIEDNQWMAMQACSEKTTAFCCFAVFHVESDKMFLLPFTVIEDAKKNGLASIDLTDDYSASKVLLKMERYLW